MLVRGVTPNQRVFVTFQIKNSIISMNFINKNPCAYHILLFISQVQAGESSNAIPLNNRRANHRSAQPDGMV